MFSHLTKIKVILLILLLVGSFVNKDFILDSIYSNKIVNGDSSIIISHGQDLDSKDNEATNLITKKVKIALLVYDLGLMKQPVDLALALPEDISLGFSAYSENLSSLVRDTMNLGHQTAILLPTKPTNYSQNDSGPLALFMNNAIGENRNKFTNLLDSFPTEQVSLYLSPLSVAINSEEQTSKLLNFLEEYQDRITAFLYLDTDKSSLLTKLISKSNFQKKAIIIDRLLDDDLESIERNFEQLMQMAQGKDFAIGAISGNLFAIKQLEGLLKNNYELIELVPITYKSQIKDK